MMEEIIKEKISADHLLYVSLKYTKTCDVIMNLIHRWTIMIEMSMDSMLYRAKKKKMIKILPTNPVGKIKAMRKLFKKHEEVMQTIDFYETFRKIHELRCEREGDFRKNVNLRVFYKDEEININMDQLKIYGETLERFISYVKQFLSS